MDEIRESDIVGKRFRYMGMTRSAPRMTIRRDHRMDGAPSIFEHAWEILDGKLVFFHRDGRRTVELTRAGKRLWLGEDLLHGTPVKMIEKRRGLLHKWARNIRMRLRGQPRAAPEPMTREKLLRQSIGVNIAGRKVRWLFEFCHDQDFLARFLLPWALPDAQPIAPDDQADFLVGTYLSDATVLGAFADLPGQKFLLSGEKETRFPKIDRCHALVQAPLPTDDPAYVRYAPTFCQWVPPRDEPKTAKCSVVDNGQYAWRTEMIHALAAKIGGMDVFGKLSGRPLGGYHRSSSSDVGNDKYLGIEKHCFYLSLERAVADDYITEKFTDAVLCSTVPVYDGAPNIDAYAIPDSYILARDVEHVDWANWRAEYEKRRPALLAQKELLRTRLNLFSYFVTLTADLSALARPRPITRH